MMERTIELLTPRTETEPTVGSGGTLNTDITEMLVLLGNRLSGIENQLNGLTKMLETGHAEPTEPTEPTEPSEPTEPTEPTEPAEPKE